jgi:hypothetical protein
MHRDGIARTLILLEGGAVHAVQIALDSFGVLDDVGEGVRRSCLKRTDTVPLGWRPSRLRLPN